MIKFWMSGCGTGMQTRLFAEKIGEAGRVCSFDISDKSIKDLNEDIKERGFKNVKACLGDMNDCVGTVQSNFSVSKFDIIHSSYALYYAKDHHKTLDQLMSLLSPEGRMYVFSPVSPHGMVDFARDFHEIPEQVDACFNFIEDTMLPYFKGAFHDVETMNYQNKLTITSVEDFMIFYRATTYYSEAHDAAIEEKVTKQIHDNGHIAFEKNGRLIAGRGVINAAVRGVA